MPFGTSFCLENQLERLSKQINNVRKWSRSIDQNQENLVHHFVYFLKFLTKNGEICPHKTLCPGEVLFGLPSKDVFGDGTGG